MSISDNARERARIARLKALESEERVQNFGEVGDSRVVVVNYDPDKKAYLVRTLGGQIGYATNISGTQLGVGATVQATRKGNGFIIDYFDNNNQSSKDNSSNNEIEKNAFKADNSGVVGSAPVIDSSYFAGYAPDGNGGCVVKTYEKGSTLPQGVYKTAKECHDSQKNEPHSCVDGKCIPDVNGKYKNKAECEAALIGADFTGGQCAGAQYRVSVNLGPRNGVFEDVIQVYIVTGPVGGLVVTTNPHPSGFQQSAVLNAASGAINVGYTWVNNTITMQGVERVDGQSDSCGDPPKRCPSS